MIYTFKGKADREYRITPFTRAHFDGAAYRSWWHNPDVTRYNSHGLFPYTKGALESFMRTIEDGSTDTIVWAIERCHIVRSGVWDTTHIGNVSLQRINLVYRSAEIAIVIGDVSAWGKGVATGAIKAVIDHGFQKLNLHRIWTGTASVNLGMQKVAEKCGMQHEGTLHNAMFVGGQYVNIEQYAILNFADFGTVLRSPRCDTPMEGDLRTHKYAFFNTATPAPQWCSCDGMGGGEGK